MILFILVMADILWPLLLKNLRNYDRENVLSKQNVECLWNGQEFIV